MFPLILRGNNGYFSKQEAITGVYNVDCVLCEEGNSFWCIIKAVLNFLEPSRPVTGLLYLYH